MSALELVDTVSTGSTSSDENKAEDLPTGVVETGFEAMKDLSSAVEVDDRSELISVSIGPSESTSSSEAESEVFLAHLTPEDVLPAFQISSAATLVGELPEIPTAWHDGGIEFLPRGPRREQTAIKKESPEEKKKREEKERKEQEKKEKEEEKKRKKD